MKVIMPIKTMTMDVVVVGMVSLVNLNDKHNNNNYAHVENDDGAASDGNDAGDDGDKDRCERGDADADGDRNPPRSSPLPSLLFLLPAY